MTVQSPLGINKFGDFAHIPGEGPAWKDCRSCGFIRHWYNATVFGRCQKAAELRHTEIEYLAKIPLDTAACKYFQPRETGMKPWTEMLAAQVEKTDPAE